MLVVTAPSREYSPIRFVVRRGIEPVVLCEETMESIARYDAEAETLFEQVVCFARGHETPEQYQQRQYRRTEAGVHVVLAYAEIPGRVVWFVWPADVDVDVPTRFAQGLARRFAASHPDEQLFGYIGDLSYEEPHDWAM